MKWIPEPDEFFVGYLPEAPKKTASILRKTIPILGISVMAISLILVFNQREFSSAEFEYGTYTTVEGYIFKGPVPHIKIPENGHSPETPAYRTILLVGFGKMGAAKTLETYQSKIGELNGKFVKLSGQLIHGHGKTLIQIEEDKLPESVRDVPLISNSSLTQQQDITLVGEIVDPKCYFGVMKPGEGKPHMSCAIRCISGGIPPVFYSAQVSDYYLLLDENLQPVNQHVLGMVGYEVSLSGRMVQFDDWKILQIKKEDLKKQSLQSALLHNLLAMEDGMTQCGMN